MTTQKNDKSAALKGLEEKIRTASARVQAIKARVEQADRALENLPADPAKRLAWLQQKLAK